MKKMIVLLAVTLLLPFAVTPVWAQHTDSADFTVSAEIPSAIQVVFVVSKGKDGETWTSVGTGSQTLPFDMEFDSVNGTWLNGHYYIIDLSTQDGSGDPAAGTPDLQIQYTDLQNQNNNGAGGGGNGLEDKGEITVMKVTGLGVTQTEAEVYYDTYGSITTAHTIDESNFAGGFARVYLGLADGTGPGNPFTNADAPGLYQGRITLTSTLD